MRGNSVRTIAVQSGQDINKCRGRIKDWVGDWMEIGNSVMNQSLFENWQGEKFVCSRKD
jgi:hypothetical protein